MGQGVADLPPSDHASENIHKHRNIHEAFLEVNVDNIVHSDLIASRDLKVLKTIDPRMQTVKQCRGLTATARFANFIKRGTRFYPTGYPVYTSSFVIRLYLYFG